MASTPPLTLDQNSRAAGAFGKRQPRPTMAMSLVAMGNADYSVFPEPRLYWSDARAPARRPADGLLERDLPLLPGPRRPGPRALPAPLRGQRHSPLPKGARGAAQGQGRR